MYNSAIIRRILTGACCVPYISVVVVAVVVAAVLFLHFNGLLSRDYDITPGYARSSKENPLQNDIFQAAFL